MSSAFVRIGDIDIRLSGLQDAVSEMLKLPPGEVFRFLNAYSIALAGYDDSYRGVLSQSECNFPDGAPLVAMQHLLRRRQGQRQRAGRVRGPSVFREALSRSENMKVRHFFIGGDSEAELALLREALTREFPGVALAGAVCPAFAPVEDFPVLHWAEKIRETGADLVWVGLGTPKQDYVAERLARESHVTVACVGAAFGFVAGSKAEAPEVVQRAGVEWLYRLASEPGRLWRRYLVWGWRFLWICFRQILFGSAGAVGRSE